MTIIVTMKLRIGTPRQSAGEQHCYGKHVRSRDFSKVGTKEKLFTNTLRPFNNIFTAVLTSCESILKHFQK